MKLIYTLSFGFLGLLSSGALAESVLAPVVEASGAISGAPKAGETLSIGAAISTKGSSRLTLTPFPGAIVSFAAKTQASISALTMSKQGAAVTRQASFALKEGTAFLAVEKVNWNSTSCEITTPHGKISMQRPDAPVTATIAVAGVHNGQPSLAVQAGKSVCEETGGRPITVNQGSVLSPSKEGFSVVNLVQSKVASYDMKGVATGTHEASAAELKKAAKFYGEAAEFSQALISSGAVSPSIASAMSVSLTAVNSQLASAGLQPVSSNSVGALPNASGVEASLPSLSGLAGASGANPANTRGLVRSPAR